MKRYITILFVLAGEICLGQTVHAVKVAVGQGEDCPVVTGIEPLLAVQVFPNPATSTLSIHSAIQNASFRLLNVHGKIIKDQSFLKNNVSVDISHVPEGVYILQVFNDRQNRTIKIIVQ
ncbi:Por secretion system C-terminal sorting domain-containing protein [Reichenbachiella faecimaris]|uniref:Por secretion system C-terminal sorting domain-containing protein n=1 Tax=Reichenbachiella faecimaris TaxID=692418 RepID=A0A1W2GJE2_REIFA|nr:T9SS type A sorting domain-containing protein [Reichenbachiella faecimaris]SMD36376.1 Por secretion system C-terminal sorting domain-containing protein [Reichenbachiella faecimaris]